MHESPSTLAGKTIIVKKTALIPNVDLNTCSPMFTGTVEDWWDRVSGKGWKDCIGNYAAINYTIKVAIINLPQDDEVLYVKIDHLGYLIHVSEIEVSNEK